MKKASVLAIVFTVLGLLSTEAKAQTSYSPSTQQPAAEQAQQVTEKQQISEAELPEGIKKALQSEVLTVWQVSEVYKVASGAAEPVYEVYFVNAEQKRAIARFDGEGNTVGLKNNITLTNTTHN